MSAFLNFIGDTRTIIALAVIIAFLAIWLIINRVSTKRLTKELTEQEAHYRMIKSIPLSLKMNKAVAIGRVDPDAVLRVNEAQAAFDRVQSELSGISASLSDAENHIADGKLRAADELLNSVERDLRLTESQAKGLETTLDGILAKETAQRQQVTNMKNRFRALKSQASENATRLSFAWPMVEQKVSDTEKMFSTFEEWMFSNDFDKANAELESITRSVGELEELLDTMPGLIEDARGVIPKMAEQLHRDYAKARKNGVYLKHLEIEKNLTVMTAALKEDLRKLKSGSTEGVREHLEDYKTRINQMVRSVKKETKASYEVSQLARDTEEIAGDVQKNADFVNSVYEKSSERFGLGSLEGELSNLNNELEELNSRLPELLENVDSYTMPATVLASSLRELNREYTACNRSVREIRDRIEVASGDEDRARKQLIKLQIIMNQMQVKIRKYKLPNISEAYDEDMTKAQDYITRLEKLIDETPLNIQLLNSTLQEALNFIYQLYNNVNNVVGTVVMVENTIVFGNRYRSTYADIDSELTRSELSFRNGQYTQALTTAIATIEKIHPGNYESMIKENAKSAA